MRRWNLSLFLLCTLPLGALAQVQWDARSRVGSSGGVVPGSGIRLRYAEFDPRVAVPPIPGDLLAGPDTNLWIVQFDRQPSSALRARLRKAGAEVVGYLPDAAYVVRMGRDSAGAAGELDGVRWVGPYHPAYRLDPDLIVESRDPAAMPARRYYIVVADKRGDKPVLTDRIRSVGGEVTHLQPGSILLEALLTGEQLLRVARSDQVLWIDAWMPIETDLNNARIQGGANYVEVQGGFTGAGIRGHVYEGVEASHPDFLRTPIDVLSSGAASAHGHCTGGIVCGNGTSHPNARGIAPDTQLYYTNFTTVTPGVSRWQVVQELVMHNEVAFTTASWGSPRNYVYSAVSAAADDIVFDHDIPWTQSMGESAKPEGRPEAWAKNVLSIGGVVHHDNANPADDSWAAGGSSTGPAPDGRVKPDLCSFADSITCSDLTGAPGYASGDYTTNFGGTSGATAICAGHAALAIQMFATGITHGTFHNPLRVPGGKRFENRPHCSTLKALLIATASQYPFWATSTDNRREHVGWGYPNVQTMYDNRELLFIVDETDVLAQGQIERYTIAVSAGQPELRVTLCYLDPPGNPATVLSLVNDLSLRVTAPGGTVYWGNQGLWDGNYSAPGGSGDTRDPVECVFLQKPPAGVWYVDVIATLIAQDGHVETSAVDADYGLVVSGGVRVGPGLPGALEAFGQGCAGTGTIPGGSCGSVNPSGGVSTQTLHNATYAYEYTGDVPLNVTGFRLWTGAPGGPVTVVTGFHPATSGGPSALPTVTGSMQVGTTEQFYECTFGQAIPVAAGTPFYVSCQHGQVWCADVGAGASGVAYCDTGSGFAISAALRHPSFHILCQPVTGAVPRFELTGNATPGGALLLDLAQAAPNRTALLITGKSDQSWAGNLLPYSLAGLGASGCDLLVSPDSFVTAPIGKSGGAQLQLFIPNTAALIGARAFQQFAVLDPAANPLGAALTGAYAITIGS